MQSNENYYKNKSLSMRYDNKSLNIEKSKTISDKLKIRLSKTTSDNVTENSQTQNASIASQVKEMIQCSTVYNCKHDDKEDESKQANDKAVNNHSPEQLLNTNTGRYQLNAKNYIGELHRALIKECNYYLVDFNSLNATLDFETLSKVSFRTVKAIKDHKIFSVLGYFPKISEEMKSRGWVEKRDPHKPPINYAQYLKSTPNMVNWIESPPTISSNSGNEAIWERMKTSHSWNILRDKRSDMIFTSRKRLINWNSLHELTTVSQMTSHAFCTKNGLAHILESYKNTVTNLMFPRCHYIRGEMDYDAFLEDYVITALIGVLKIIIQSIENSKMIFSETGNIPYEMIIYVRRCVFKFLSKRQRNCIERDMWKFECDKDKWNEFMGHYTKLITDDDVKFCHKYTYEFELDVYAKCKYLLDNVKKYCPQYYMDGDTNTWIVKPTSNCSGHGISLARDLNVIKEKIIVTEGRRSNFILQKYIEKPLLVYTCKIDLRQWFLVTSMKPVVVWMYKEGYVRFCANSFSMKNMHQSIHLSNVRLQMKYRNVRRSHVPDECMWDYQDLKNYLTAIGQTHVWDELIFPGMSESVYAVLQAATDTTNYRVNTFQLFGADFVITDNFIPYLIEINSIPGLNPSTSVIANLAPNLLADIVKVVIDHNQDPDADTGLFAKVTPELRGCDVVVGGGTIPNAATDESRIGFSVPPVANSSAERHRRWIDHVNEKLAAIRFRVNGIEPDRYLGYNRDNMLMTLMTVPSPQPPVQDNDASAAVTPVPKNASYVGHRSGGRFVRRPPMSRDEHRKR